jgi:hypothetical protein
MLDETESILLDSSMIITPTVRAIMTPTIITLEACGVRRITAAIAEIPTIAAIKAAGAII